MVRLTTLGSTDLRLPEGVAADAVLRQPRRFALLVYLAIEGRAGFLRRDRVLAMFWPESTDVDGRRALSQALHFLRRHLGPGVIETRGQEELRVSAAAVSTDVCELLATADDSEAVLRLWAGEFLPGFHSGGVRAFDEWVDGLRQELHRIMADAAWLAARRAADRGELVAAGAYARRLAALCQDDDAALRRVMSFQAEIGDRAGAVDAYEAYATRLAHEYEMEPSEATRSLAQEIRAAGAVTGPATRHPVPSSRAAAIDPAADTEARADAEDERGTTSPAQSGSATPRRRRRRVLIPLLGTLVLLAAYVSGKELWHRSAGTDAALDHARLVVEASNGQLGEAVGSELLGRLRESQRLEVVPAGLQDRHADGTPEFTLRLTVLQQGSQLHATALLLDMERRRVVSTSSLSEPTGSGPAGVERLASRVARFARTAVGAELDRRRTELASLPRELLPSWLEVRAEIAAADSLRSKGLNDVALLKLLTADSEVARLEPRALRAAVLPRTRAELAYGSMAALSRMQTPDWARARTVMVEGIAHATRALELAPDDPRSIELRGLLRQWQWMTTPPDSSRFADSVLVLARGDLRRATELSPGAAQAWIGLSTVNHIQGRLGEAYEAAQRALAADAFLEQGIAVRVRLFTMALELNDMKGAGHWCELIRQDEPAGWLAGYCGLALLAWASGGEPGDVDRATTLREQALRDPTAWQGSKMFDAAYAVVLARAGRTARARAVADTLLSRMTPGDDALAEAAWVYGVLGDTLRAKELLDRFVAVDPARRGWVRSSRRFAE